MIGRLRGIITVKRPPELNLDVNGVGYELQASMNTFYQLPDVGQEITLHTHFIVREDAQLLFGFHDERERSLFRALIKVNGVGPKSAIAILSSITPDAFVQCIMHQDTNTLVRMPGVGKKTAERLVVEMQDRLNDWKTNASSNLNTTPKHPINLSINDTTQDAIRALIALGYKPQEASRAISNAANTHDDDHLNSETLIRLALKNLVK